MYSKIYFLSILLLFSFIEEVTAQKNQNEEKLLKKYTEKIDFIPNQGQWEKNIVYRADVSKTQIRFLKDKVSFGAITKADIPKRPNLDEIEKKSRTVEEKHLNQKKALKSYAEKKGLIEGFVWNLHFEGANPKTKLLGKEEKEVYFNYYLGNTKQEKVKSVAEVWYEDVYPNTDIRFYSAKEGLEYDIILYPKSNPENIKLTLEGIEKMNLDAQGNLVYETPWGNLTKEAPYAYQIINGEEIAIATQYRLDGNAIMFDVLEEYNAQLPLIIDPLVLKWSTYLGGIGEEDKLEFQEYNDNLYLVGTSDAVGFPTTVGSFQQTFAGGLSDLFLSKLDKNGNLLVSTYIGGNQFDYNNWAFFRNGTWYLNAYTSSPNFPVTSGAHLTTHKGFGDDAFLEVDENLLLVYSSFLGGIGASSFSESFYNASNSKLYLVGHGNTTYATNKVLNSQNSYDDAIISYNTVTHQIEEIMVMPSDFSINYLLPNGSDIFAVGRIYDYYTPTNYTHQGAHQTTYGGGFGDVYVLKIDDNFTPLMATYLGGNKSEYLDGATINNGALYIIGNTNSSDFPTTMGAFQPTYGGGTSDDIFVVKMDLLGNVLYSTYIGGAARESIDVPSSFDWNNSFDNVGNLYLVGETASTDFPTTLGAFQPSYAGGPKDNFTIKINLNGQADWSSYIGGSNEDKIDAYEVLGNEVIISGNSNSSNFPTTTGAYQMNHGGDYDRTFFRLDFNSGIPSYSTYIGGSATEGIGSRSMMISGTDIYLLGGTSSPNLPVTSASQATFGGDRDLFVAKIRSNNTFDFVTYLGGNAREDYSVTMKLENGFLHLLGPTEFPNNHNSISNTFPTTTTAFQNIQTGLTEPDLFYSQLDATSGALLYSTLIGGSGNDFNILSDHLIISGKDVYIAGTTKSNDFPVTQGAAQTSYGGDEDIYVLKLSACVDSIQSDSIHPLSQTVCTRATVDPLIGSSTEAFLPIILRNNITDTNVPSSPSFSYSWQDSIAGGNWMNITGATGKDFLPPELTTTTYYRRVVINACGDIIGYSNEAVIQVTTDQAPIADAGDGLLVCAGGNIQIGGPTTGGTPGYTYTWTPTTGLNNPTLEQPIATLSAATVYTLEVRDANGCVHKDQTLVDVITTSAGADAFACQGVGVRIGTPAPAGGTGLTYNWFPTTSLNDPTIPQPIANPSSPTIYTVTVTGPSGCPIIDDVLVTPIAMPTSGTDETLCSGSSVLLGQASLSGYTYEWSPGLYLNNSAIAQPTFVSSGHPSPNPFTYSLTTIHNASGCAATTSVDVTVVQANAGINGCGPRFIGSPDQSGGLASYTWTVLSGDVASLLTPNIPEPIVDPSSNTLYELSVSLNGITCTNQVLVTANCGCPNFSIAADSEVGCPIGDSTLKTVLSATFTDTTNYLFSWSPAIGLSDTSRPTTTVTGNFTTNRIYTLTITNKLDSTITCSETITVLGSLTPLPQVEVSDTTTCPEVGVNIGIAAVSGKSYQWFPSTGLDNSSLSNPIATLSYSSFYVLEVTDNVTGCTAMDTAFVLVREVGANAGEDAAFCDGAVVTLGVPALPHRTYNWQPANALHAPTIAQPTDTIYITSSYFLTVADTLSGCVERDTVTFTEMTAPISDAGADSVSICQGGSVLIGTPAVAGVTYSWIPTTGLSNPNSAQPIASPTSTITYQLIASTMDGIGCYTVDEIKVNVSPLGAPIANAGNDQTICIGGTISIGTPANPNHTYAWSPATGLNDSSFAQPMANPLTTTTYVVTITDLANGCSNIDEVVVNVNNPVANTGNNRTACPERSFFIGSYSGTTGYTYSWTPTTGLDDPSKFRPTVSGLSPNSNVLYTLLVTDGFGCTATDTVRVIIRSGPNADAGPDLVGCSSMQIGTPFVSGLSYSWSPSSGLSSSSVSRPIATVNIPTTYALRVSDANFCYAYDTVIVTPTVVANGGANQIICNGESALIGTPAIAGATYTWSPSIGLNNANISQPLASPMSTTTYIVSATIGSCTKVDSIVVTVITPTIDLGGDIVLCNGSCATIGIPSKSGKNYQWSPSIGLNATNSSLVNACPTLTTVYTLTETDIASGCVATDDILVEVKSTVPPVANAGSDTTICPGNSVVIGTNNNANYTYTWSSTIGLNNPYISNPVASPSATTSYSVTIVDNTTGCFNSDSVMINIGAIPTVPTLNDITICTGSLSMIGASTSDNYAYNWSPTLGLDNPMSSNPTASPSATTTYQLLVTDTVSGCTNSNNLTVTVSNSASPVIADAGTDIYACIGDSVILGSSNTTSGATYTWSPNTLLSSGNIAQPIMAIPSYWVSGIYTLTVTNLGCTSVDQVVVTAKPQVVIEAGPDNVICNDNTILAATPTSVVNQWSLESGPNTPLFGDINNPYSTISGLIPGIYTLRWNVSGNSICNDGYDRIQINVGQVPALNITNPSTSCPTVDITGTLVTAGSILSGATLSYWIDSTASIPLNDPNNIGFSGQYFIRARTNLGCEDIKDVDVTIDCNGVFLPIELLNFRAQLQNKNTAFLDWETAEELNMHGFEIEHALPSIGIPVFEKIAFVNSTGSMNMNNYYNYEVPDLVAGTHYFRLKQLEKDGGYTYSTIRTLSVKKGNLAIMVYPNPMKNNVTIELAEMPKGMVRIEVLNNLGQVILYKDNITTQFINLNLSNLASANYMIKVKLENTVKVFKLIKE